MVLVREFTAVNKVVYEVFEDESDPDLKKIKILAKQVLQNELETV